MQVAKELVAINELIEKLEDYGFECHMKHFHLEEPEEYSDTGNFYKACTLFQIVDNKNCIEYIGAGLCSVDDVFCKAKGAQVAFGDAMLAIKGDIGRKKLKDIFA